MVEKCIVRRIRFILVSLAIFILIGGSYPQGSTSGEEKDLEELIGYYYLHKDVLCLERLLDSVISNQDILKDREVIVPLSHFFATVAHHNSDFLYYIENKISNTEGLSKNVIISIFNKAKNFSTPPVLDVLDVDVLWAEFYASGDSRPVKELISLLDKEKQKDYNMVSIARRVYYSLYENVKKHKRVREIIEEELDIVAEDTKEELKSILNQE